LQQLRNLIDSTQTFILFYMKVCPSYINQAKTYCLNQNVSIWHMFTVANPLNNPPFGRINKQTREINFSTGNKTVPIIDTTSLPFAKQTRESYRHLFANYAFGFREQGMMRNIFPVQIPVDSVGWKLSQILCLLMCCFFL
jgi:hypothetical protein